MGRTGGPGRDLSFTEIARRRQLVETTLGLVAEHGYAGISLGRIAERAGLSKAAVLYHFRTTDAVVAAAYEHALTTLVEAVGGAVDTALATDGPPAAPGAYVRTLVAHLTDRPLHTRMIIEAATHTELAHRRADRWTPLARLVDAARATTGATGTADARTVAVLLGGAVDAIVAEHLEDPGFDPAAATQALLHAFAPQWLGTGTRHGEG